MRADVLANSDLRACGRRRAGLRLAHASKRQRAERGESTSEETGATQEAATIERVTALAWQRGGERAATRLTFRSFDQHGCLLSSDTC
jgi:hypothetical protein